MAKVYTGRDGVVLFDAGTDDTIDPVALAKVTSYSFQADLETLETTTLGDSIRSYTPGILGWSGSATLMYYKDDDNRVSANRLLRRLIKTGTAGVLPENDPNTPLNDSGLVVFILRLVDGTENRDIKFTAYITSASISASVGEIISVQVSFQVTGALATASW